MGALEELNSTQQPSLSTHSRLPCFSPATLQALLKLSILNTLADTSAGPKLMKIAVTTQSLFRHILEEVVLNHCSVSKHFAAPVLL